MSRVINEIKQAINTLDLTLEDVQLLPPNLGEIIFKDCLAHFVRSGDRRWWWEDFNQEVSFCIEDAELPFERLNEIIPELESKVWLIVEDDDEPFYPVYEIVAKRITEIIGESFGFEYYIIPKDKSWLICENHHSQLIGIGLMPNT